MVDRLKHSDNLFVVSQASENTSSELDRFHIKDSLKDSWPAEKGFRGFIRKVTGFSTPPGKAELSERLEERTRIRAARAAYQEDVFLTARIRRRKSRTVHHGVDTCGHLSVVSEKGGVGKTTVSSLLAMTISRIRSDEDIAVVDLNPDRGSLADRMSVMTQYSIRDMVNHYDDVISGHVSPKSFMSMSPGSRVWVLPGDTNPERRESTVADDVRRIFQMFAYHFSIAVLDNGTGISHSAMEGNLSVSHGMVLVVENTNDSFKFIESTLDRLEVLGYSSLRRRVVLVINEKVFLPPDLIKDSVNSKFSAVTGEDISNAYRGKVKNTIVIPFDPTLARSGPIMYDQLLPETKLQVKKLAAAMLDDLVGD